MQRFQRPPFNLCAQCGDTLVAPIWAEHLDERHVRNLWSCENCGYEFERTVLLPILDAVKTSAEARGTSVLVH